MQNDRYHVSWKLLNMVRVGRKNMSQAMRFERNSLSIARLKHESMTEKAHTGRHCPVGEVALVQLKEVGTCWEKVSPYIVWIKWKTATTATRLKLVVVLEELHHLFKGSLRLCADKVISQFV